MISYYNGQRYRNGGKIDFVKQNCIFKAVIQIQLFEKNISIDPNFTKKDLIEPFKGHNKCKLKKDYIQQIKNECSSQRQPACESNA